MDTLLSEYSRRIQEGSLPEIAVKRGISIEQARGELGAELDDAVR